MAESNQSDQDKTRQVGAGTGGDGNHSTTADEGSSPPGSEPPKQVNPQIVNAVRHNTAFVLDNAGKEGKAIGYQKASQAAAFAVQDATDYMRNIMAISMTAQGIALQKMVENPATVSAYEPILQAAQLAVTQAQLNFAAVGTSAAEVTNDFPS